MLSELGWFNAGRELQSFEPWRWLWWWWWTQWWWWWTEWRWGRRHSDGGRAGSDLHRQRSRWNSRGYRHRQQESGRHSDGGGTGPVRFNRYQRNANYYRNRCAQEAGCSA